MLPDDDYILEMARTIRPFLSELLQPADAEVVDGDLARLLADAKGGQEVAEQILTRLADHSTTHNWGAKFLARGYPPDLEGLIEKGVPAPLGYGDPVRAAKYICPSGDYVFYRHAVGQSVPRCRTHDVDLRPAGG